MLEIKNITKDYAVGDTQVHALRGVNLRFRKSEFVSILGPSGCGKTTLLNIIGGLDRYTDGDLLIRGRSTKQFKDSDWDFYRNHSIGFVFQSYNLIPHQTVLANVELALTLSGVGKAERRARATAALEKVGLGDQLHKKPNQMSGGQMQRVAIARALVNDPDILLADEPTGALDTETSVQIMEILKEISADKLIIMVTHNPKLGETYSSRIVRLLDGQVISDSHPYTEEEAAADQKRLQDTQTETAPRLNARKKEKSKRQKTSMSFATAVLLSFRNLLTKKTRTFLTAFAGSIGIIGIALILSLSNGIQAYINKVQEDTLSTYPLTLAQEEQDYSAIFKAMMQTPESDQTQDPNKIYVNDSMANMMSAMTATKVNNLKAFKTYFETHYEEIKSSLSAYRYAYALNMQVYSADGKTRVTPTTIFENLGEDFAKMFAGMDDAYSSYGINFSESFNVFSEMIDNEELLSAQYDVLAGKWPTAWDEVVLVVNEHNQISNMALYILGVKDQGELEELMKKMMNHEYELASESYDYQDFLGREFNLVLNSDYYEKTSGTYTVDGKTYPLWTDLREASDFDQEAFVKANGIPMRIVGIIRPSENAVANSITGAIGYRSDFARYIIRETDQSALIAQQKATPAYDLLTGNPFPNTDFTLANIPEFLDYLAQSGKQEAFLSMLNTMKDMLQGGSALPDFTAENTPVLLKQMLDEKTYQTLIASFLPDTTYDGNLTKFGFIDPDSPSQILFYPVDFASKENVENFIAGYNETVEEADQITYTDMVGLMMSSITTIINAISYVLIAFVSISLVVSSIMIGIITYISVLERTKEIGILRAIGASKRDISRVFNAETLLVGFISGLLGILVTVILNLPINLIIRRLSGISGISSALPVVAALILVAISMLLTLIAGLIPSKLAAKKDPVVALRTE